MKKFLAVLICSVLLLSFTIGCISVSAKSSFSDVPATHWAYDYIDAMIERKIVNGYSDGTFRPSNQLTRSEWAKLLTLTADIEIYDNYEEIVENCASDVFAEDWFAPYMVTIMPYFKFDEETKNDEITVKFSPKKNATRLEITKSIIIEKGYDLSDPDYSLVMDFKDYTKIPGDDMKYIAVAVEKGIINGFNDNTFRPNDSLTRAEACTILYRAYIAEAEDVVEKKPYTIKKLVSAQIEESIMATLDDRGNLYYIDAEDYIVYKINLIDRIKVEYFDPSVLLHEVEEDRSYKEYSDYLPKQVYYDTVNHKLLLSGCYQQLAASGQQPITDGKFTYIYDITENNNVNLYCIPYFTDSRGYWANIQLVLKNGDIVLGGPSGRIIDRESGEKTDNVTLGHGYDAKTVLCTLYGNKMYYFGHSNAIGRTGAAIFESNPDSAYGFDSVTEIFWYDAFGIRNGFYYLCADDQRIYKVDLKKMMISGLDVIIDDEHVDFADFEDLSTIDPKFHVINDSTYIFYDHSMEAFRVLEPTPEESEKINTIDVEEFFKKYEA